MKSFLLNALINLRYSYWFIPSLMAMAAVLLAGGLVYLDIYYLTEIPEGYEWLFRSQPSGARALLSTVAGSTITVAGVVFSMTIMAVSHATSNYGSRLLLKFLKDRRNQIALGTFIATFIYCLLVLRTVSSAEQGTQYPDFVPHLAILGALGMALASVAVLIAFIHHVPDTIHIGDVASDRGEELIERLNDLFPEREDNIQESSGSDKNNSTPNRRSGVTADKAGYLQTLDVGGLLKFSSKHDLSVVLHKSLGDFVYAGESLLDVRLLDTTVDSDADSEPKKFEELKAPEDLLDFFVIGRERTPTQDTRFLIEELSQIAIRALSPGINDPFTAITCIDWLGNSIAHTINRANREPQIRDKCDIIRLEMPCYDFTKLSNQVFSQLRPYVVLDLVATLHMAKVLTNVIACSTIEKRTDLLQREARVYLSESKAAHTHPDAIDRLETAYASAI